MELEGRVALVTGGAVRLGRAIALGLAAAGMDTAIHYHRSAEAAEATADEVRALGRRAVTLRADLGSTEEAQALIPRAGAALGTVHVLVNSASIFQRGTLQSTTVESWDRHQDINLRAPFLLSQAFAAQLPDDGDGHIVNLTDWRALRPGTSHLAYIVSKSGLLTLTQSLARALGPRIRVNALALGAILPAEGEDAYFARLAERLPVGHTGNPDDVVGAILYLLRSDYVTGEILQVTGGEHLL